MVQQLERYFDAYAQRLRHEVRREVGRMVSTIAIAFAIVAVGGGVGLTVIIYALSQSPSQPLAIISYIMVAIAAIAVAVAAGAFYLIFAVVRGFERAGRFVLDEIARGERELAHALPVVPGERRSTSQ
jgi:hypothetical protein